jgi:hypothetical protein
MQIDRNELAQEITLREHIQNVLKEATNNWASVRHNTILENKKQEQALRNVVQNLISKVLYEDMNQTKQDAAISLVRDTLLAIIKIMKADQSKFKDPEVQDGFIKYCMLALRNDFEENRGAEGEDILAEQIEDDGDENIDISIKASDDPMFIKDEEVEEEEEPEEIDIKGSREEELFLTLNDAEKVGFRYAKETTWPKVTKQIRRIHRMALPDKEIAKTYEEWLTKNIQLHGENTKEETAFDSAEGEVEVDTEKKEEEELEALSL